MCGECFSRFFGKDDDDQPRSKEVHSVRVFAVSPVNPPITLDADLYQMQDKHNEKNEKIAIKTLHDYIQAKYSMDMTMRMLIHTGNILVSKMIQNLYVTSLGGITQKSVKVYRIQLMINATHDLPNIDNAKIEMLRVPLNNNDPDSVEWFLDDVADKIQASSFKNISTLIYCYDGMCNSLVLVACYFIKYTDLMLSEITQHIAFSRKGYYQEDQYGCYTEMVLRFARKYRKIIDSQENLVEPLVILKPILTGEDEAVDENNIGSSDDPEQDCGVVTPIISIQKANQYPNYDAESMMAEKSIQSSPNGLDPQKPGNLKETTAQRKTIKSIISEKTKPKKKQAKRSKSGKLEIKKPIKEGKELSNKTTQKSFLSVPDVSDATASEMVTKSESAEEIPMISTSPKKRTKLQESEKKCEQERKTTKEKKGEKAKRKCEKEYPEKDNKSPKVSKRKKTKDKASKKTKKGEKKESIPKMTVKIMPKSDKASRKSTKKDRTTEKKEVKTKPKKSAHKEEKKAKNDKESKGPDKKDFKAKTNEKCAIKKETKDGDKVKKNGKSKSISGNNKEKVRMFGNEMAKSKPKERQKESAKTKGK